jgi:molybdopterin-containing oxidoreductase family iron-sulfur binding subunit
MSSVRMKSELRIADGEFGLADVAEWAASRREFLKLMGASAALAGLTACRWPKETIVPAARQPVERMPGVAVQYATAFELAGVATGLLVTSYDGRPIKIEGNEKHPFSRGKTNHWMQASILDLYDPDRSRWPVERRAQPGQVRTWDEFRAFARNHCASLRVNGGQGFCILSEASSSPTLADLRARLLTAFPQATWYEYEPVSRDNEREGTRLAFGKPYRPHLHLDQADVIVGFDSDFLMLHLAAVKYAGDFASRRRADDGTMSRLYVLESNLSVTGSMADQRYAMQSSQIRRTLEQVAARIGGADVDPQAAAIGDDLLAHKGRCVVIAGLQQPPEVHALAHALNARLGAHGTTVTFTEEPDPGRPTHAAAIRALADRIRAGDVQTLVILGGNPAYNAPADLGFVDLLPRVPTTVHLSPYDNETSRRCTWHVPQAHYLESWDDARAYDGTLSIVQPLIAPLYDGQTASELLALLSDDPLQSGYELVRRTFGDREALWRQALEDGVVPDTAWPERTPSVCLGSLPESAAGAAWEVVFAPDYHVHDGRFANNAWLQEWPDPITKLTWDNAALVSPADAKKLGIGQSGDLLRIEYAVAGETPAPPILEMPAFIVPGHAVGSITLPLGYGRAAAAGKVADGAGFDTYRLRIAAAPDIVTGVKVSGGGRHYDLATTQDRHAIQSRVGEEEMQARIPELVREATLAHYRADPDFVRAGGDHPPPASLWEERQYRGHKWGTAIDLSACTGCGACVIACQAENNVPVVGKAEVGRGREMHWLRVDRYFRGDGEVVHQPVACLHCEFAPCEQVCPVAATVHDEEGLNVMVYNRCVGTRYCSNNCPVKVRRFNWFYNHHGPAHPRSIKGDARSLPGKLKEQPLTDIEKMLNNPNVTMRSRGVMEKCTFCVQRIAAVKIKAKNERWDRIPDGLIVPACAQACPTDAIVFGDLNDPSSRVRRLHEHNRAYALLPELNLKPRTKYLAKLNNPAEAG